MDRLEQGVRAVRRHDHRPLLLGTQAASSYVLVLRLGLRQRRRLAIARGETDPSVCGSSLMTDAELAAARDQVMNLLSWLSSSAREAKQSSLTRFSSDLYYATNRAWLELDYQRRRQQCRRRRSRARISSAAGAGLSWRML